MPSDIRFFGIEKTNKNQREKLRKTARAYIHNNLSYQLESKLKEMGITGFTLENVTTKLDREGQPQLIDSDKDPTVILLHYPSIVEDIAEYVHPIVKIEISCLSMDEPTEERYIYSLISENFKEEDFDANCKIKTVLPTRTFLEKIFLLAEEFQKAKPRSNRMSRHLYDLEKLMDSKYGIEALSDLILYKEIVEHRKTYYSLKYVNYDTHDPSLIDFNIPEKLIEAWRSDYAYMQKFFIYGKSLEFEELLNRIKELNSRVRLLSHNKCEE